MHHFSPPLAGPALDSFCGESAADLLRQSFADTFNRNIEPARAAGSPGNQSTDRFSENIPDIIPMHIHKNARIEESNGRIYTMTIRRLFSQF